MDEVLPPCLSPAERGRNLQDKDTLNATLDLHQPSQDSLQPFFLCSVVGHLPKTQLTALLGARCRLSNHGGVTDACLFHPAQHRLHSQFSPSTSTATKPPTDHHLLITAPPLPQIGLTPAGTSPFWQAAAWGLTAAQPLLWAPTFPHAHHCTHLSLGKPTLILPASSCKHSSASSSKPPSRLPFPSQRKTLCTAYSKVPM